MGVFRIGVEDIVNVLDAEVIAGPTSVIFHGLNTDSRKIKEGELFWALKGERFDGHDFVKKAVDRGALGAVVEKAQALRFRDLKATILSVEDTLGALGDLAHWWRAKHPVLVGAITGSVGKTTTKEMVYHILTLRHEALKTEGNLNNLIGLPLTLLGLEDHHSRAVVELGMNRPGEIARLTQIADPDVGVITEVGEVHLQGLGNLLGVARAKLEMAQEMNDEALLVINGDNALLRDMAGKYGRKLICFGFGAENDVRALEVQGVNLQWQEFILAYGNQKTAVRLKVPGRHNVMNALAAAGLCIGMGEDLGVIAQGLSRFTGMEGRFQIIGLPTDITLVDDTYNSNPVSLKAALKVTSELSKQGRDLFIGLGDMLELGQEAERAHVEAGKWVAQLRPRLFVCLGQYAHEMVRGALNGGLSRDNIVVAGTVQEMACAIEQGIGSGSVVLLKGSRMMRLEKVKDMIRCKLEAQNPKESTTGGH